jgi:hypothetical protein
LLGAGSARLKARGFGMRHGVLGSAVAHILNFALFVFSVKVVRHRKQILPVEKRKEFVAEGAS